MGAVAGSRAPQRLRTLPAAALAARAKQVWFASTWGIPSLMGFLLMQTPPGPVLPAESASSGMISARNAIHPSSINRP
jgi:hypothetical protein